MDRSLWLAVWEDDSGESTVLAGAPTPEDACAAAARHGGASLTWTPAAPAQRLLAGTGGVPARTLAAATDRGRYLVEEYPVRTALRAADRQATATG